jgi:putative FmdB family regulatory protein
MLGESFLNFSSNVRRFAITVRQYPAKKGYNSHRFIGRLKMPTYDYRCESCGKTFQARHGFNDAPPSCPICGYEAVKRLIITAPRIARGMITLAGDSSSASKEQLRDKWAEETPKLRKKLVDKLGEDYVNRNAPTLNKNYSE